MPPDTVRPVFFPHIDESQAAKHGDACRRMAAPEKRFFMIS